MKHNTVKKHNHLIKPRYVFCIVSVIVLLLGYFVFLCVHSRNYMISLLLNGKADPSTVRIELTDDSKVKVNQIRQGRFMGYFDTLEVEIESVEQGYVGVSLFYDENIDVQEASESGQPVMQHYVEPREYHTIFQVNPFGMIYNTTYDDFNGLWTVKLVAIMLMLVVIITLSLAFRERAKNGEFTYSMVLLGGIVFFLTVTMAFSIHDMIIEWDYRRLLNAQSLLFSISRISHSFISVTAIPMLLFSLLLSISNIRLVRHEGFRPQNLLGVLLGFAVIIGIVLVHFFGRDLYEYSDGVKILVTVINSAVSFSFSYLECLLVSTIVCAIVSTRYKLKEPVDYIIILGCAIRKDGSPTPILRGRIDRALAFEKEQAEKWNKHATFVPSGGQGSNEVISEAESMKRYLMEQGIPEERILKEDKSVNTYQNMAFSKKIIEQDAGDLSKCSVAFSTTNYHVFRGYTLAQRIGMRVKGLSAKTKLYFFPNAFLREFIGLLFEKKLFHLFVLFAGIVFFASIFLIVWF